MTLSGLLAFFPVVEPSAFQVSSNSSAPTYQKPHPVCSHCGGLGHIVDRCYKKHGYPPGMKYKGRSQKPSISTNMVVNSEPSVTQSDYAPSVNYANVPPAALIPDQMQQFIAYFSTQLHNHSITPPTPVPEGLPASTLAVPSTSKVSGTFLPLILSLFLACLMCSILAMLWFLRTLGLLTQAQHIMFLTLLPFFQPFLLSLTLLSLSLRNFREYCWNRFNCT